MYPLLRRWFYVAPILVALAAYYWLKGFARRHA